MSVPAVEQWKAQAHRRGNIVLKIGKRELQKCTFNRKEALFTPSDTATGYLSCAVRGPILLSGTGVLNSSDFILRMYDG